MGVKGWLKKEKRYMNNKYEILKINNAYIRRFFKYAFFENTCRDQRQYEAVITRWYHTIEKGLAYLNFRAGFGQANLDALLTTMENYIRDGFDTDAFFFQTAISTVEAYVKKNKEYGYESLSLNERLGKIIGKSNEKGGVMGFIPLDENTVKSLNYEEFVLNRHSLRHFSPDPVNKEQLENAIRIAQHTPSACNRQGWSVRIIESNDIIKLVLKNQNGNEGFGHEFDKVLFITADLRCFNADREIYQAYIDGGMYAQSILNALHYEHIASVPLSASLHPVQEANVRKLLMIEESEVFIMFIGIGNYPEVCQTTRSERRPAEMIYI